MAGTLQPNPKIMDINERPLKPKLLAILSTRKAALGRYPDSSKKNQEKKNKIKICGIKTNTPPTPPITPPSTTKEFNHGMGITLER